ncbi:MAG: zinc ribbon domain-containing protein [Terracidiphilus sp.]
MPAYEYECAACSKHFERRQKMSDAPITVCPECGGSAKRLISGGAGTISKGSGHSPADARQTCDIGGACCGQSGGCCGNMACEE